MREFSAHFSGNEISFGLLLASWMLWGGAGSIWAQKFKPTPKKTQLLFFLLLLVFPFCLGGLRLSRFAFNILPGEMTGVFPMFLAALCICFFVSLPLGILFVFNTFDLGGNLVRVYILESLGSAVGGFCVYFLLIPLLTNWQAASVLGAFVSLVLFVTFKGGKRRRLFLLTPVVFFFLFFFDFPSQQLYWKPFTLVKSKDTSYGKLQVLKTENQISLYSNGLHVYSYPDPASAEESVHFPLLQNPEAEDVLLIGGGMGGALEQILKYPRLRVDYVELDPEIIKLSLEYLPEGAKNAARDSRVRVFYDDGVSFITKNQKKYDTIILNLPDPSTAQLNRLYTKEFFLTARNSLNADGIFSFRVSSAENYISNELLNYLSSLYHTLGSVFADVSVVPGNSNIFIASSHLAPLNAEILSRTIRSLNLQNRFVSPEFLVDRLNPIKVNHLQETLSAGSKAINLNLTPISYFLHSILWAKPFLPFESRILSFLPRLDPFWLLDFPLVLFVLVLGALGIKRKGNTSFYLAPLMVLGFTTIAMEIALIFSFQTIHGYLYQKIALLFSSFMIGLFLGAASGRNVNRSYHQLPLIQSGFLLLILFSIMSLSKNPSQLLFHIQLVTLGFLGGKLFVVANSLFLRKKINYGLGYGLDLLGSFFGALAVSTFLIPLVSLPLLLKYVFLLNSFCLLFLIWGFLKGLR